MKSPAEPRNSSYDVTRLSDINPSIMDRMRGRADKFRDFLSDTCCTCLSSVPSFALIVLAIVLVMLLIATIPLAFALTYWNLEAQHLVTSTRTNHPFREHDFFLDNITVYVKMPSMIKSSDFFPFKINSCRGFGFSCTNNPSEVIGTNQRCDGVRDCEDFSDEFNCHQCQTPISCRKSGLRVCLRGEHLCNNVDDCDDGFDEIEHCNRETCNFDEYRCKNSTMCISKTWMCDGDRHCPLGDDEEQCHECRSDSKMCKPGLKCIPKWELCDGKVNCGDKSDEMDCDCKTCSANGNVLCNGTQTMCLPIDNVCDGVEHCPDGEDEHNCSGTCTNDVLEENADHSDSEDYVDFKCGETTFDCWLNAEERICIPRSQVCDGIKNCLNGTDEFDCGCTHSSSFKCLSKTFSMEEKCIPPEWKCDGFRDCDDDSDELGCNNCTAGFHCDADNKCIMSDKMCDGQHDCSDGQDEKSCSCEDCHSHPFKTYYCSGSSRCFRADDVCDPYTKCPSPTSRDKLFCAVREGKGVRLF